MQQRSGVYRAPCEGERFAYVDGRVAQAQMAPEVPNVTARELLILEAELAASTNDPIQAQARSLNRSNQARSL